MAEPIDIHLGKADFPYTAIRHIEAISDKANIDEVNTRLRSQAALLGANAIVDVEYAETMTLKSFAAMRGSGLAVHRLSDEVVCPVCAERIKRAAIKCRFCGADVPRPSAASAEATPMEPSDEAQFEENASSTGPHRSASGLVTFLGVAVVIGLIVVSVLPDLFAPPPAPQESASLGERIETSIQPLSQPEPVTPPGPPPPPPSPWDYSSRGDEMSDTSIHHACTVSTNSINLEWPYGPQSVSLCVRQHPRWGQDVIVRLARGGQFICRSYANCIVRVRFDEAAASGYSANEPADGSSDTIFIANDARFIANLKRSSRVIIEAEFYQSGAQQMTFNTEGLEWPRP